MRQSIFNILFGCLLGLTLACCKGSAGFDPEAVGRYTDKINNCETLTESDYSAMTDIMGDAYEELLPRTKEVLVLSAKAAANDKEAAAELERKSAEIEKRYSDLNPIMECLMRATPEEMGDETYRRFHKMVDDGQKSVEEFTREIVKGMDKE